VLLTRTRRLASASRRALGASKVVSVLVDSMRRTDGVAAAMCVQANVASAPTLDFSGSRVAWLAESGLPARPVARNGERMLRIGDWPTERVRQLQVSAR
jgi:hypothetical protein